MIVEIRNRGTGESPVIFEFREQIDAFEFASTAVECMVGDIEVTIVKDLIPER